jgi:hypothetical protein
MNPQIPRTDEPDFQPAYPETDEFLAGIEVKELDFRKINKARYA